MTKNLFFDYANAYKKKHKEIAPAAKFQMTDADYAEFIASLAGKDYSYSSQTERLLSDLRAEAEKENKLTAVKADLDDLKEKMLGARKTDLTTYKAEIKRVLETQIVSRYYYEKGKVLQSFQYDKELAAAKTVLSNSNKVLAILKGDGEYRTIGSPVKIMTSKN
jgi:carboxyl-terminal processing protease